jgi:hypothetical protein
MIKLGGRALKLDGKVGSSRLPGGGAQRRRMARHTRAEAEADHATGDVISKPGPCLRSGQELVLFAVACRHVKNLTKTYSRHIISLSHSTSSTYHKKANTDW